MARDIPQRNLAEKINYLFEMVRHDDGSRLTGKQAVAKIRAAGTDMSESHLSELRRGVKSNPTKRVLEGLGDVFGVPATYFFQAEGDLVALVESELELRAVMREAGVWQIANRAQSGLSPQQQAEVNRVLTQIIRENMGNVTIGDRAHVSESSAPDAAE